MDGLELDVGKPIVSTRSLKTAARVKLGATRVIAIPSGLKTQAALLLRVKRLPDDAVLIRRAMIELLGRMPTVNEQPQDLPR